MLRSALFWNSADFIKARYLRRLLSKLMTIGNKNSKQTKSPDVLGLWRRIAWVYFFSRSFRIFTSSEWICDEKNPIISAMLNRHATTFSISHFTCRKERKNIIACHYIICQIRKQFSERPCLIFSLAINNLSNPARLWFCHFRSQENIWKRIKGFIQNNRSSAPPIVMMDGEASEGYLLFWLNQFNHTSSVSEDEAPVTEKWWSGSLGCCTDETKKGAERP